MWGAEPGGEGGNCPCRAPDGGWSLRGGLLRTPRLKQAGVSHQRRTGQCGGDPKSLCRCLGGAGTQETRCSSALAGACRWWDVRLESLMKTLQAHLQVWTAPQEPSRWPDQILAFVELPSFTEETNRRGAGLRAGRPEARQGAMAVICKTHLVGELVEKRARRKALNRPKPETVPLPQG